MDTLTLPTNLNTSQYPIIDEDLLEKYKQNRAVSNTAYYILIIAYTILIIMGSIGNFFSKYSQIIQKWCIEQYAFNLHRMEINLYWNGAKFMLPTV